MNYVNFLLFLFVISAGHLMKCVFAFNAEGILHGILANESQFPYQAAILGRRDRQSENKLLCNGALIAPKWILTVAHCVMMTSTHLKQLIFTAIAGSRDLSNLNGRLLDITFIYTYGYNAVDEFNNIAMAKTAKAFPASVSVNVIRVANLTQSFVDRDGLVSGFGSSEITTVVDEYGDITFTENEPDLRLRYATVNVRPSSDCGDDFQRISIFRKFCGIAEYIDEEFSGACSNDVGSPLVIDNEVVGLASTNFENCDDTEYGSLYINVSDYHYFVHNVMDGTPMDFVLVHRA